MWKMPYPALEDKFTALATISAGVDMPLHQLAGQPAPRKCLIDVTALTRAYYVGPTRCYAQETAAWPTDKGGIILGLLAAEITAVTGRDPAVYYERLVARLGRSYSNRVDSLATTEMKEALKKIRPTSIAEMTLAGDPILTKTVNAS
jgi:hypothetical protein